jgi:hypothetical protein
MSLIRKADVKTHLSTASTSVYPFGLKRTERKAQAESKDTGPQAESTDLSISPSHPVAAEDVANAQVGGAVGVPASPGKSGKGSW